MAEPVLRPLSLGEILDRTFSLYRRHFLLFVGITAIPHLLILVLNLWQTVVMKAPMVTTKALWACRCTAPLAHRASCHWV